MLLNSLLRRLNGGTDTKSVTASSSHRQFSPAAYEKFSKLPKLIIRLLSSVRREEDIDNSNRRAPTTLATIDAQKVFPALEIIERFGLPNAQQVEIRELVKCYMESPVWPIREKAAKAFAYVVHERDIGREVGQMLEVSTMSQNRLHGSLLCVRCILARVPPLISKLLVGICCHDVCSMQ